MSYRKMLTLFVLLLGLSATAWARQPNVIVILSDDQGWGDFSFTGNKNLSTPNIDSLGHDGAYFDRFFVCPVCSPTRAEFLTGRYHPRAGVYSTSAGGERLDADEMTIAETFRAAGYATAAFGKWHNGMQHPYHPNARGFDEYYGFCSGHWGNYFDPMLERNGEIVKGKGFCVDDFTSHAIKFMESNQQKPFFVYLPLNTPHSPMQVPDRFWNKFKDKQLTLHNRDPRRENIGHIRAALAMCENIDWNVGRILKKLEELKLADDTIVCYFNDNGPNGSRWNGDMKGRKGSTDEGGVRTPLFVRWPGKIKKGTQIQQIAAAIDLLPTLASMAGIAVQSKKKLDGIDVSNWLLQDNHQTNDRVIINFWRGRVSARNQRFRLDNQGKLFELELDPGQRVNVAQKHPAVTKQLRKAVAKWKAEVLAEMKPDERTFPIGHSKAKWTQIPSRDGVAHGGIKRSNKFPNCSYFRNWKSLDDKITWNTRVASSGTYRVQLYYTCAESDVGSSFELAIGDKSIRAIVKAPHDPPEIGAAEDRVKRNESYVKDFRPMDLGTVNLDEGDLGLTLRATKIANDEVMEVRLILFERISD